LKIYILKKKQLIWAAIVLAIIIVSAIIVISIRATQTINFLSMPNSFKADVNNDGKVDTVIAKLDETTNKYSINVVCSDDTGYVLEPDPVIKSFGDNISKTPINITFKDINGDDKEEIFIQSSDEQGPILHIYKYTRNKIVRIASGRYSMYGLINNTNNDNNMLVLLSNLNGKMKLTYLNSNSDGLIPCVSKVEMNLGINAISSVINFIEQRDVETINLNSSKNIKSTLLKGTLIDGILNDVTISDNKLPELCTYVIRTTSDNSNSSENSTYRISLMLSNSSISNQSYSVENISKIN
jgi:hypothetical protein